MSHEYDTYEKYYREVKAMAKRYYDFAQEGAEEIRTPAFDPPGEIDEVPHWAIVEAAINNHKLLQYYKRSVVYHSESGFYGEGGERYYGDPKDQQEALFQMAQAGLYNDVIKKVRHIEETREDLDEAINLIEGPIYDEGVRFEYEYYQNLSSKEPQTYTLESVSRLGDEWAVIDPNGNRFEVISPKVAVNQRDQYVPEFALKLFLDNICAKQDRMIEINEE
jgi:hypothetical protein